MGLFLSGWLEIYEKYKYQKGAPIDFNGIGEFNQKVLRADGKEVVLEGRLSDSEKTVKESKRETSWQGHFKSSKVIRIKGDKHAIILSK